MDPRAPLGQAEGAELLEGGRGVVRSKVLPRQTRQQAEAGLSWVMVSGWLEEVHRLERQMDGHVRILARARDLVLILV